MNVLSLFDGMSCGQISLKDMGVNVTQYYASEIDKHAIEQTQLNFPNTIQLGSVTNWQKWDIEWDKIDLVMAGSPCQGFSFAGKQLAFDDPRSKLFFEFIAILRHVQNHNPNVKYLLENVKMAKEHELVISRYCGVAPIEINSALVSAQNRQRLYWTNISNEPYGLFGDMHCTIPKPKDRSILLRDILESEVYEKYYLKSENVLALLKYNNRQKENGTGFSAKFRDADIIDKMDCLKIGGGGKDDLICVAQRGRGEDNAQQLEHRFDNKTNCLTSVQKDNYILYKEGYEQDSRAYFKDDKSGTLDLQPGRQKVIVHNMMPRSSKTGKGGTGHLTRTDGKTYCLDTGQTNAVEFNYRIRRLTPTECSRLQTIPSWYKWQCSDTQQYRMLGNGWTVEVIKHILSHIDTTQTIA